MIPGSPVPDRILLKREPLRTDERLAIQTPAEIGYEMLSDSNSPISSRSSSTPRNYARLAARTTTSTAWSTERRSLLSTMS